MEEIVDYHIMHCQNISRNIDKIKKLLNEEGISITLKKIAFVAEKKLNRPSVEKTCFRRGRLFKNINIETRTKNIEDIFSLGLFRPLEKIKSDLRAVPIDVSHKIIKEVQRILDETFTIYGCLRVPFNSPKFSWLHDPLTGFIWPCDSASINVITQKPLETDIKTIWEIARFQFLCPLAQAYILTKEERYARFAYEKVNSWIDENQFPYGPHWSVAMESSIRLINWCIYLPLLDIFNYADLSFKNKITKSILEHLIYIRENLEISPSGAGNHYLADLVGLLMACFLFPSLDWASECSDFAMIEFEKEVQRQFKWGGINFEGSLPYHRLSSEMLLMGAVLIKQKEGKVPIGVIKKMREVAEFTKYYTSLCEECPAIGDNDSGIFVKFFSGQELNRHQYLNNLFDWILDGCSVYNNTDAFLCLVHFTAPEKNGFDIDGLHEDNGLTVKDSNGLVITRYKNEGLIFNTLHSFEGHAHNDKLSIYPIINQNLLFADRGSFSYTGYPDKRHQDRSTASHNCPVVNNWEQNRIWKEDVFYISKDADCGNAINSSEHKITITGWHKGYARFSPNLKMFRKVEWDVDSRTMLISDWGEGKSKKNFQYTWFFIINPSWCAEQKTDCIVFSNETATVRFEDLNGVGFTLSKGTYCPTYQQEVPCQVLTASYQGRLSEKTNFLLSY